ncbi:hypothetical protein [Actinacidiphila bryophytorum]|uniref:Nucleotide exchange factor GrpE n=1 Tax=Actinacidiphila bryophytorum TaxID=1436133 RepID=A0A9W4MIE8_9ACTN|nr:hypothetical protein [Actinacidiphila bryophytorum]MBM9437140.1 hypothetical protein [Actinacidiphila bryophytorum]MBN6545818.1 hypothetical protein [Actinacidiphila bryophytorum]CAG7646817.1 conserved hypothetical protein [Actinacidiphila bryophytorum]
MVALGPGAAPVSRAERLRGHLRQRRQSAEFRIADDYPPAGLLPAPVPEPEPPAVPEPRAAAAAQASDADLADLATQLWRLGRKLAEPPPDDRGPGGAAARRKESRHLRAAQDALGKAGVRAEDHDGTEFDIGLTLDVLAYQPVPGATRETVHETVRPSVYRDGRRIQMGQVIVAQPEGEQDL